MGLGGGSASSSSELKSGSSTLDSGLPSFQNSNPLNPNIVRFNNNFNFAEQSDPETYNAVQSQKKAAKQAQSKRLSDINKVYDIEQGIGATEAIQQQAKNRPVDTITDPASQPYSGIGNNVAVGLNKAYEGIVKLPRFVYTAAAIPQNFFAEEFDMPELEAKYDNFLQMTNSSPVTSPLTMLDQLGDYYSEEAEGYAAKTQKYDDTILGSLNKGNFKQAGSQILDQIAESAPSIAVMAMTSGAGNAAGLSQTSKTLANALPFMSQRNAELQDDGNVPEWLKPVNAAANGLAEVIFDQSFGTQAAIQGILNRFQSEGREAAVNAAKELTGSFLNGALNTVKTIKPFAKGAIEEASTKLAQNIVDKYTIDPEKDLMDGVADAAIVGSAMTGSIETAGKLLVPKQKAKIDAIEGQQQSLLNELGNENLTPQAQEGIKVMLDDNQKTVDNLVKESQDLINKLSPEQLKQMQQLNNKIKVAESVIADPNASEEVKKASQVQIDNLNREIDAIKPEENTKSTKIDNSKPEQNESKTRERSEVQSSGSLSQEIGSEQSGSSSSSSRDQEVRESQNGENGSSGTQEEVADVVEPSPEIGDGSIDTESELKEYISQSEEVALQHEQLAEIEEDPIEREEALSIAANAREVIYKAEQELLNLENEKVKEETTDATKIRENEQSDLTEREGTNGQQQGKQENRDNQEAADKGTKGKTSSSDSVLESGKVEGKVVTGEVPVIAEEKKVNEDFKKLTHKNIQSEEVSKTLNNVERETGRELTEEEKEYRVTKRTEALTHGAAVVEKAKEEFGKTYVSNLLDYLNDNASTLSLENRALINISLELDLERQLIEDPDNVTLNKQLKLVRDASTKFQRSAAIATGYGILRQIARVGYDINQVTDQFFSEQQRADKAKLDKAIEATPTDINKEAELQENEIDYDVEQAIAAGIQKEINALYENLPSKRRQAADKAIAALDRFQKNLRAKSYSDVTGMIAFIDAGITTTKAAIKAGVNVADAVEMGINKIKELLGKPWAKENEFRKDMLSGFTTEGVDTKQGKRISKPKTEEERLELAKSKIRERIVELNQQIADKHRELKSTGRVTDEELRQLQIEESTLKKEANQYLTSESKQLLEDRYRNLTVNRLEAEIASIEKQIADGEKSSKKEGVVDSPQIAGLRAERKAKVDILNAIDGEAEALVKQSLIDAGYGREITVTTKEGKEKRNVLDWRKLAGEEGSIQNIQENVEASLKAKGYTDVDIYRMQQALTQEYNRLHASIIEKSLNELQTRNQEREPIDIKTSAKKLAELYNYGLFDEQSDTYDNIVNRALGLSKVGQKTFEEAKVLARALSDMYRTTDANGRRISEFGLKEAIRAINSDIERLLTDVAWEQSNMAFKVATVTKEFMGLSQRAMLQTVKQILENPISGFIQRGFTRIGYSLNGVDTDALSKKRTEAAKIIYEDIVRNGGLNYGEIITPFVTRGMFEKKLDKMSDSKVYHTALSALLGRAYLDGADSMHKSALTERYFVHNLVRVLIKKGMPKQEAIDFVSNQLTGQKFTDALGTAKQIIDKANQDAGKKIINDNPNAIYRLAQNIVKDALVVGDNITLKEVESSYKAAYKAAGYDLGHEANNIVSETVSNVTTKLENSIKEAIKEKKWNHATALTFTSILTKNILNPFVSGGTNWIVLSLQKTGVDVISPLVDYARQKENKLDLSTKEGVKNMENALLAEMRYKNTINRVVIGAMATTLVAAAAIGSGADEDLYKWLKKNEWAKKYFKVISPQALIFLVAQENKQLADYLIGIFGFTYDSYSDSKKLTQAFQGMSSGKKSKQEKGVRKLGEVFGGHTSFPGPWRVARDVENIYRGIEGKKPVKPDYKKGGFWEGYLRNGVLEYFMLER